MITIYHGDNLKWLKVIPDNSIDALVTDPPYGLSFMGRKWDYDVPLVELWAECLRVLKPGGHLLAFAGTRTQHRMAVRIEDAGFEIRDMIAWVYGSGFPKSLDIGKAVKEWDGWGTALKPALEPITLARKPLAERTVAANVLEWGTGGVNVDAARIHADDAKGYTYTVKRIAPGATQNSTGQTKFYDGTMFTGRTKDGRFPANLIHDGSDEVVELFPVTTSGTFNQSQRKAKNQKYGQFHGYSDPKQYDGSTGSAARFFYCAKASRSEREAGLDGLTCAPKSNHHPTVKPIALMRYLCRLVTPPGGVVLDPFVGSGTTGCAAVLEGFGFIGMEREEEYVEIARRRIQYWGERGE